PYRNLESKTQLDSPIGRRTIRRRGDGERQARGTRGRTRRPADGNRQARGARRGARGSTLRRGYRHSRVERWREVRRRNDRARLRTLRRYFAHRRRQWTVRAGHPGEAGGDRDTGGDDPGWRGRGV